MKTKLGKLIEAQSGNWNNEFGNKYTYPCKTVYQDAPERIVDMANEHKAFLNQSSRALIEGVIELNKELYDPIELGIWLEETLKEIK